MPTYQYTVRDATGAMRTGRSEAESEEILKRRLLEQGFTVQAVTTVKTSAFAVKPARRMHRLIRQEDRTVFWLEFSLLLDCNTPLLRALEIGAEQTASARMRETLHKVMDELGTGGTLFDAMSRYPEAFDQAAVGMMRAGDVGGSLPEAVRRLSRYLEAADERRREERQRNLITAILLAISVLLFLAVMRPGHL
jgi:type II secretory pathway component PulF